MTLAQWQLSRLQGIHAGRTDYGNGPDGVTVLAYHWGAEVGKPDTQFFRIESAFRETWLHCGMMKSVIVTDRPTREMENFAGVFPSVEIQVEGGLVPADIHAMSVDCNANLFSRFSTPHVLVIQNDGFPLRPGLESFIGKYDFIGAPYVRNVWWKNIVCGAVNYWVQNGGFSLRSKRICEAAARFWREKYAHRLSRGQSVEDLYYTQYLPLHEPSYRKSFRLANNRESLQFSWDALVPIPPPARLPFGFHREASHAALREKLEGES